MKQLSPLGVSISVQRRVRAEDSVQSMADESPEYARKPNVLGSAHLLKLAEGPCMEEIRKFITADDWSLGKTMFIEHHRPAVIGTEITITASCLEAEGPSSAWKVDVRNEHAAILSRVWLWFKVVDSTEYEQRLREERRLLANVPVAG
ncbi:thioesterase, FlK family [Amycolatopsis anabasis]|uniref:thioesterase, FlK family n=1 Tax=Amycolatopsis anabasis TaxID=1840409 RepID=UPI00131E3F02|nr:hypothetical protein [Amycolatopsis anabasis]